VDNKQRRSASQRVLSAISAVALAHNVTPSMDEHGKLEYQASSPDEVALVKFTESVGMTLYKRSLHTMTLKNPMGEYLVSTWVQRPPSLTREFHESSME
jgi:phospholipid-translocating ATPase